LLSIEMASFTTVEYEHLLTEHVKAGFSFSAA